MKFKLIEPVTWSEAVHFLQEYGENVSVMAGGTDLLVRIKRGIKKPAHVLSLAGISGTDTVKYIPGKGLEIGAMVTHGQIANNSIVTAKFAALAKACATVGSPQIRNSGTLAGNLANASPAADTAPALLALGAEITARGAKGTRRISLDNFFLGPGQTALEGEMIESIIIPDPEPCSFNTFMKLGRRKALEIAICSVAVSAVVHQNKWKNVRIAMGAVAPTPVISDRAGQVLENNVWSPDVIAEAANIAAEAAQPIDDVRASAGYRKDMIKVLISRAMQELIRQARGECSE